MSENISVFPIEISEVMVQNELRIKITIYITAGQWWKRWTYQIHSESPGKEEQGLIHWADHDGWAFSLWGVISKARMESLKVLEHVIQNVRQEMVR